MKTGLNRVVKACFKAKIMLANVVRMRIIIPTKRVPTTNPVSKFGWKEVRVNTRKAVSTVQGFRRMVAGIAIDTWKIIPRQHQIWISVDDLVEDGMFCAYQMVRGDWYDSNKSALSTAIFHTVRKHLFNEYIVRYGNEQRFASLESAGIIDYDAKYKKKKALVKGNTPTNLVSLDIPPTREEYLPLQLSISEETIYNNVLTDCFVVPVLGRIYSEASSKLQHEMVVWFLQQPEKLHLKSPKFRRAAKEFRMLSKEFDLTYFDCEHLVHSPKCMNRLSHELLAIPYDLDHPTPLFNKEL
jgi:hypothetical protein